MSYTIMLCYVTDLRRIRVVNFLISRIPNWLDIAVPVHILDNCKIVSSYLHPSPDNCILRFPEMSAKDLQCNEISTFVVRLTTKVIRVEINCNFLSWANKQPTIQFNVANVLAFEDFNSVLHRSHTLMIFLVHPSILLPAFFSNRTRTERKS